MDVRVVPIQSRRLVGGNAEPILEGRIGWLDRCLQNVILVTYWRQRQAVKMQIRRGERHGGARAGIRGRVAVFVPVGGMLVPALVRERVAVKVRVLGRRRGFPILARITGERILE